MMLSTPNIGVLVSLDMNDIKVSNGIEIWIKSILHLHLWWKHFEKSDTNEVSPNLSDHLHFCSFLSEIKT